MRFIGFSSGALAKGDFRRAIDLAREAGAALLELSALRLHELEPLVDALPELLEPNGGLDAFRDVSFHAPSAFEPVDEEAVVDLLGSVHDHDLPIVIHPDILYTPALWRHFGPDLRVENMDVRKPIGQTTEHLQAIFADLPEARLCLDLAHARQVDPTLGEAERMLLTFAGRLAEIHLSHVDAESSHHPLTADAVADFQDLASLIPTWVPVVLETPFSDGVDEADLRREIDLARAALS